MKIPVKVRQYLYSIVAPLLKVAMLYGYVSQQAAGAWLAVAAAVLGIGIDAIATAHTTTVTPDPTDTISQDSADTVQQPSEAELPTE